MFSIKFMLYFDNAICFLISFKHIYVSHCSVCSLFSRILLLKLVCMQYNSWTTVACMYVLRWWRWVRFISSSWIGFRITVRTRSAGRTLCGTISRSTTVSLNCLAVLTGRAKAATGHCTRPAETCSTTAAFCAAENASRCSAVCTPAASRRHRSRAVAAHLPPWVVQPANCSRRPTRVPPRVYSTRRGCADCTADCSSATPRRHGYRHAPVIQQQRHRWSHRRRRLRRRRRWPSSNRSPSRTSSAATSRQRQRVMMIGRLARQPAVTTRPRPSRLRSPGTCSRAPPTCRLRCHPATFRRHPRRSCQFHRRCRRQLPKCCRGASWSKDAPRRRRSSVEWSPNSRVRSIWPRSPARRPLVELFRTPLLRRRSSRCRCLCRCTTQRNDRIVIIAISSSSIIIIVEDSAFQRRR